MLIDFIIFILFVFIIVFMNINKSKKNGKIYIIISILLFIQFLIITSSSVDIVEQLQIGIISGYDMFTSVLGLISFYIGRFIFAIIAFIVNLIYFISTKKNNNNSEDNNESK